MHLARIDFLLWAGGLVAHLTLLAVLITRSRARVFPIFTSLISMNVAKTVILYMIVLNHGSKHTYLFAYCSFAVADVFLQIGVVYELALHTFCPVGKWVPEVWDNFLWASGICVTVAIALSCLPRIPMSHPWILSQLTRVNFFSSMLMSELFVGMIVLSITVGLPWKPHTARIAQGLGSYSLVCVFIEAANSYPVRFHGEAQSSALNHLRLTIYLIIVGYWIVSLWLDAPAARELPEKMRAQLMILHQTLEFSLIKLRTRK